MTTNKKVILALIALVFLGVIGTVYSKNGLKFANPFSKKLQFNTVQDAVNYEKGVKCELVQNLPGQTNTMTIYTQNGDVREEVSTAVGRLYVLINKDFTYMWGTKAPGVAKTPAPQAQQSNALILKTPIPTYTCTEQALPVGTFNPPN